MADRIGQQLGQYRLIRFVGKSGAAEVYLGEHVRLLTQAAVKVWNVQLAGEEQVRFQEEALVVARLAHPHIARVFDFATEEGTPFLAMDYAPNGSLRQQFPRSTPQAPGTILPYVWQVAEALHYAHGQHLIHRDVKPENMLLGARNEVMLSDFGAAVVFQHAHYQAIQEIPDTATYIAPEQIRANARSASDQYALATIIYEWLSGAPPFQGSTKEVVAKQLFTEPQPLHERVRTISPAIEAVVMGALSKDPADRFSSVASFATAFEEACQAMPALLFMAPRLMVTPATEEESRAGPAPATPAAQSVTPVSSSTPPAAQPFTPTLPPASSAQLPEWATGPVPPAATHVPLFSGSSAPLAADSWTALPKGAGEPTWREVNWIAVPTAHGAAPAFPPPVHLRQVLSRRTVLLGGAAGLTVVAGGLTWLGISKIFTRPMRSSGPTTAHKATATPTNTATPTPVPLGTTIYTYRGHSSFVRGVSWSLDGKHLASASDDHTAQVWDAFTGAQSMTYKGHSREVMAVAWSPNNTSIASGSQDQTLRVWDAFTGTTLQSYTFGNGVMAVAWSPDGKYLAAGSRDYTVQVWDTTTWQRVRKFNTPGRVNALAWSSDSIHLASGDSTYRAIIWNVAAGDNSLTYRHHTSAVLSLAWSPDGKQIASGADLPDTTVQCWNTANGQQLWSADTKDHTPSLAWSSNTGRLAAGGSSAYLLNPSTGAQLFTRQGDAWTLAWSPNGIYIASGGQSTTVQVWQAM